MEQLERLGAELSERGLLSAPEVDREGEIVVGGAHLRATGAEVTVNVDPELEDRSEMDIDVLVAVVEQVLALPVEQWQKIVDAVAEEIEDTVGDQEVEESTDLRDDLALRSVVVFHDAVLLSFAAPKQFPDSWIRVQLDEDLALEEVVIDEKDDVDAIEFDSLDDLLDHLSSADDH